jgi:hypothetical protein
MVSDMACIRLGLSVRVTLALPHKLQFAPHARSLGVA